MKKTILLTVAAAGILALTSSVQAGEPLLSPRAKANQIARVSGVNTDRNLVSGWYAGAAYKAFNTAPNMVASGPVPDIDLAHAPRPTMSPKDPRYEAALRANAASQAEVQIAPLK